MRNQRALSIKRRRSQTLFMVCTRSVGTAANRKTYLTDSEASQTSSHNKERETFVAMSYFAIYFPPTSHPPKPDLNCPQTSFLFRKNRLVSPIGKVNLNASAHIKFATV